MKRAIFAAWSVVAIVASVGVATFASQTQGLSTQQVVDLLNVTSSLATVDERSRALSEIERSTVLHEDERVRQALIMALDRANEEYYSSWREDGLEYTDGQGELRLALIDAVIALGSDAIDAIPVLVDSVDTGNDVQRALVRFGEDAVDHILMAWHEKPSHPGVLGHRWVMLLETMALLADQLGDSGRVASVAQEVLTRSENRGLSSRWVLRRGVDLAMALGDPHLMARVDALATNPWEVRRLGVDESRDVRRIRQYANDAIGGGLADARRVEAGRGGTEGGEWRSYGGDIENRRYSPLEQIEAGNFNDLDIAWRMDTSNFGSEPEYNFQATPLMVGGVLYSTAGTRRAVIALDAGTGELLWMHRLDEGERGEVAPRDLSGRGLAYRDDGGDGQVFYVTRGYQLVALNAVTGTRIGGFGEGGIVDLTLGMDQEIDPLAGEVGLHAAPLVADHTIVIGAAHRPGGVARSMRNTKGYVRGFDADTGERKWIFHTIPGADEFGNDTWLNGSWRYTGNTGVWGQISADLDLGIVYLPTEMPTNDYYGGHRLGDNLFSDSIVAVDIDSGERLWHYQAIRHDVWDWDFPAAPVLVDVEVDGVDRKLIAQPSKQAWLYVLDRLTGEPIWRIEERETPPSDVPGELLSPTQPFPTRPPAYDRQGVTVDDLIDFTPELRSEALEITSNFRLGSIFTPPIVADPDGPYGTLMLPSTGGGANWPGGSVDPGTGIFYQYSSTQVASIGLVNDPERSDMNFIRGNPPGVSARRRALTVRGLPLVRPPWGRISAIDLKTGDLLWQIPHGETPDNVRNHPALQGIDIPRTGRIGRVGTLVTKTLLVAGEPGTFTTPSGEVGAMLRAYDKGTGEEVGAVYMPAGVTGSPMTYMHEGRQYIVTAIGGAGFPGELVAYRLPAE